MRVSVISSTNPAVLSKQVVRQPDGTLSKISSAHLNLGQVDVVDIQSASGLIRLLDGLHPNQAVAYGVPPVDVAVLTSRKQQPNYPGSITRSDDYFKWPKGPGVMVLDYDPPHGGKSATQAELLNALFSVAPALAGGGWAWRPSASGNIYDQATGQELEGLKGQRLYVLADNAADVPRAGAALHVRLWLAGHGRIELAQNGAQLERSLVDTSMWQPSRLDFAAGAICGPGLERRPAPGLWNDAAPVDTAKWLADPTPAEQAAYRQLVAQAKDATLPASRAQFEAHVGAVAAAEGVAAAEVRARYDVAMQKRVLCNDFVIQLAYGEGRVAVKDILLDPKAWHGKICFDPVEPEYNNYHPVGKIFVDERGAYLDSKAHGGAVYRLGSIAALAFQQGASTGTTFRDLMEEVRMQGCDLSAVGGLADKVNTGPFSDEERSLLRAELAGTVKDAKRLTPEVKAIIYATGSQGDAPRAADRLPQTLHGHVIPFDMPVNPSMWAPFHTKGKDQKPKGTPENFKIMLAAYGVSVAFNDMAKTLIIRVPGMGDTGVLKDEAAISKIEGIANLNDFPKGDVSAQIVLSAFENTVYPPREFVESTRWDGLDHLGALFAQLSLAPGEDALVCGELFRRWFRGAAGMAAGTVTCFEQVLVLVDPKGGAGKTRFFRTLCPPELRKDSLTLDTTNKDSVKEAISYWLVELGELDGTFSKSEAAHLKSFLSRSEDEIRLPYGRVSLKYPRRTAFFSSVNSADFLVDDSENRRYWPIGVTSINYEHSVNVQQVWAQALAEHRNGHPHFLSKQEMETMLKPKNEAHRATSPVSDMLSERILGNTCGLVHMTVTNILKVCGMQFPTKRDTNEAANWLRRNGIQEVKRCGVRGFMVPNLAVAAAAFVERKV
jgi:hypothetical protein